MDTYQFPDRFTPDELDYSVDWTDWLASDETIISAIVIVAAGDIVVSRNASTSKTVVFWLSGGTAIYQRLTIRITTSNSPARIREIEATIACYP